MGGVSIALYRRYRPALFAELIGQGVVAETLRNEVRTGSFAHAYLFAGTRGTGKTSTARILSRAVNCAHPQDGEPDNTCAACVELLRGASVDVLEVDAASNRGIDEMRDLRDKVKYLPASLRRKVYIIDEAHMLTTEAWNAFLKTLEEPPDHVLFVLATTEPHKVPETVRSRVQRFDFRRVTTGDIEQHLAAVCEREAAAVSPEALRLLAQAAQGSVRDALSLLEQALAAGETPLSLEGARRALGLADPATLHRLLRALAGSDAADALRAVSLAFEAGADPRQLLRDVARLARAAEMHALGYPEGAGVSAEEAALCADLAAVAPAGLWLTALDLIATADMNLRQPVDARLQVELCLLRLLRPLPGGDAGEALAALEGRLAALERTVSGLPSPAGGGAPEPSAAPAQAATAAALPARAVSAGGGRQVDSVEGWRGEWPLLIEAVTRVNASLAGVLRDCKPLEAEPGRLLVGTSRRFHFDQISDPQKARIIGDAAGDIAGAPVAIESRFTGEAQAPTAVPAHGSVSDVTQAVLDTFSGSRVTSTRIRDDGGDAPRELPGA